MSDLVESIIVIAARSAVGILSDMMGRANQSELETIERMLASLQSRAQRSLSAKIEAARIDAHREIAARKGEE